MKSRLSVPLLMAFLLTISTGALAADADCDCKKDDFPTTAIADYVLACMAANGNKFETLHQCSCSIDFIKSKMVFEDYEKAQTVMQAARDRGQRGIFYRSATWAKEHVERFQKVQSESTLRCF